MKFRNYFPSSTDDFEPKNCFFNSGDQHYLNKRDVAEENNQGEHDQGDNSDENCNRRHRI